MDRNRYDQVVETFFTCHPREIGGIFSEFLDAMVAAETLPSTQVMSTIEELL